MIPAHHRSLFKRLIWKETSISAIQDAVLNSDNHQIFSRTGCTTWSWKDEIRNSHANGNQNPEWSWQNFFELLIWKEFWTLQLMILISISTIILSLMIWLSSFQERAVCALPGASWGTIDASPRTPSSTDKVLWTSSVLSNKYDFFWRKLLLFVERQWAVVCQMHLKMLHPPKSTESRNSNVLVQIQIRSTSRSEFVLQDTKKS